MMTAQDKSTEAKSTLKENVTTKVKVGDEKIKKIAKVSQRQALERVNEADKQITAEVEVLQENVYSQLVSFKQELLNQLEVIKDQARVSQKDLIELKGFIKAELNTVLEDLSQLGKELKQDVSQISLKHKNQFTDTFKRSKEHTLEAWHKVSTKQ